MPPSNNEKLSVFELSICLYGGEALALGSATSKGV